MPFTCYVLLKLYYKLLQGRKLLLLLIDYGCIIKTQYFTVIAHKMQSSELKQKPEIYALEILAINQI